MLLCSPPRTDRHAALVSMFQAVMFNEPSFVRGTSPAGSCSTVAFPSRSASGVDSRETYGRWRTSSAARMKDSMDMAGDDCAVTERAKRAAAASRVDKAEAIFSCLLFQALSESSAYLSSE